jgi:hypothetical protein
MSAEERAEEQAFAARPAPAILARYAPQIAPQQAALVNQRFDQRILQLGDAAYEQMRQWPEARRNAELDRLIGGTSTLGAAEQLGLVRAYMERATDARAENVKAQAAALLKAQETPDRPALPMQEQARLQHEYYAAWKRMYAAEPEHYQEIADAANNYAANIAAPRSIRMLWQETVHRIGQKRVAMMRELVDTTGRVADTSVEASDFMASKRDGLTFVRGMPHFDDPAAQRHLDELNRRIAQLWADYRARVAERAAGTSAP